MKPGMDDRDPRPQGHRELFSGQTATTDAPREGLDWVMILAVPAFCAIGCIAVVYGDTAIAGMAVTGLAGVVTRLYK